MMKLQEYLTSDPSLREPAPEPEFIEATKASRASRQISLHGKGSVRGFFKSNCYQTWYESELEHRVALALLAHPMVRDVVDQPPAVTYVDDDGVEREHTFDWLALTDSAKYLVAVKPSGLVEQSGIARIVELVAEQISPKIAEYVMLVTEEQLTPADNFNAEMIHLAQRDEAPRDDAVITKLAAKLRGTTTIGRIVDGSRLGGHGFNAVVRAIADGRLALAEYGAIDYAASVKRGSSNGH